MNSSESKKGKKLSEVLKGSGIRYICGGKGVCGSCKVRILEGRAEVNGRDFGSGDIIKACQATVISDDIKVEKILGKSLVVERNFTSAKEIIADKSDGICAALDIGTTTLALAVFDSASGKILANSSAVNPQCVYGQDVISRIFYATNNAEKLHELQALVVHAAENLLSEALDFANVKRANILYVAGNTTMLHIFFGEDVTGLGIYPFKPKFLDVRRCRGGEISDTIRADKIISLPSISAYVGGDITASCLTADMFDSPENSIMVDVGTNAEIAMKIAGKYYATSAAAGGAFESGRLACGMPAEKSAISRFIVEDNKLNFETIDGGAPLGICGSGYLDFLACAHKLEIISDFGRIEGGSPYKVSGNVEISDFDIAELLKSKGAVGAALRTLMRKFNVGVEDFDRFYIAGGFGRNINSHSAKEIGMIPNFPDQKIKYLGNASLCGAYLCGIKNGLLEEVSKIVSRFESVSLNLEPEFEDDYIDSLSLDPEYS